MRQTIRTSLVRLNPGLHWLKFWLLLRQTGLSDLHSICSRASGWLSTSCAHSIKVGDISSLALKSSRTHDVAVARAIETSFISNKSAALGRYATLSSGKSNSEARDVARDILGENIIWNWDCKPLYDILTVYMLFLTMRISVPRTREGYYHYAGGVDVRNIPFYSL